MADIIEFKPKGDDVDDIVKECGGCGCQTFFILLKDNLLECSQCGAYVSKLRWWDSSSDYKT